MGLANAATSSLQFHPGTWMPYGSAWDKNDLLYVSFRHYTTATVDSGLPDGCRNKVQIHRQPLDPGGCGAPILITQLDERGSWPKRNSQNASDLISPLLVVTVTSIDTKTGTANVKVCRASQFTAETGAQCRDGLDNNCDGLVSSLTRGGGAGSTGPSAYMLCVGAAAVIMYDVLRRHVAAQQMLS
ncbi:hypothetical protein Vretifemale_16922 [Volvox reticuliferus]|nr:hypothetical protein Vretifemale_16922 [Volvox reticuliferus]